MTSVDVESFSKGLSFTLNIPRIKEQFIRKLFIRKRTLRESKSEQELLRSSQIKHHKILLRK